MNWKQIWADATVLATVAVVAMLVLACGTPAPKTNAQKCADMGGAWSSAAKTCSFQSE